MTLDVDTHPHCERDTAEEIEITEAMIQAGLREMIMYSPGEDSFEFAREVVRNIYCAMELRRRNRGSSVKVERVFD